MHTAYNVIKIIVRQSAKSIKLNAKHKVDIIFILVFKTQKLLLKGIIIFEAIACVKVSKRVWRKAKCIKTLGYCIFCHIFHTALAVTKLCVRVQIAFINHCYCIFSCLTFLSTMWRRASSSLISLRLMPYSTISTIT